MVIDMKKTLKPSLRFKGFTDTWEQHKLGDLGKTQSGIGFPDSEQGGQIGMPFYKVSDMNTEGNEHEMVTANHYVTSAQIAKRGWKPIDVVPAILFAKVGAAVMLNRKRLISKPFLLDNNTMAYSFGDSLDTSFGKSLFDTIYLPSLVQVGALPSYNGTDINGLEVKIPNLDEQVMIGSAFDKINKLITLHQHKYDKLVNIKKALLDKMFPKNGELVPAIRFEGFTDAWEQCNFKNIFDYERPDAYIVENDKYSNQFNTPVLTANKGFILGYTNETRTYDAPCIIFDDFTLDSKFVDFPFMVKSSAIKILTTKSGFELRFSYELLNTVKIENLGHARHYISVVQPTKVRVPKYTEQIQISKLFKNIDNLITLHQRKYDKLVNIKKALLQRMFV